MKQSANKGDYIRILSTAAKAELKQGKIYKVLKREGNNYNDHSLELQGVGIWFCSTDCYSIVTFPAYYEAIEK